MDALTHMRLRELSRPRSLTGSNLNDSWPVPSTREECKYFLIRERPRNSARARGNRKNPIYGSPRIHPALLTEERAAHYYHSTYKSLVQVALWDSAIDCFPLASLCFN